MISCQCHASKVYCVQVYDAYVHLLLAKHAEAKHVKHAQSYVSAVMPQHTSALGGTAKLPASLL